MPTSRFFGRANVSPRPKIEDREKLDSRGCVKLGLLRGRDEELLLPFREKERGRKGKSEEGMDHAASHSSWLRWNAQCLYVAIRTLATASSNSDVAETYESYWMGPYCSEFEKTRDCCDSIAIVLAFRSFLYFKFALYWTRIHRSWSDLAIVIRKIFLLLRFLVLISPLPVHFTCYVADSLTLFYIFLVHLSVESETLYPLLSALLLFLASLFVWFST